jgi:hypothetical protein
MDTEMKWATIAIICVIVLPLVALALGDYNQSRCRLEAIKASMPADDIAKVCGK